MKSLRISALIALAAFGAACTPVKQQHGFVPDENASLDVQPGIDTKATIQARMGSPSTTGVFDAESAWYYVSSTNSRYAYHKPKTVERRIIAIRFGADDVVSAVEKFGMDKGRVISYSDEKTPTRGRELGVLEQLLGNIGQAPPIKAGDDQRR